jgi:hypothetical protein
MISSLPKLQLQKGNCQVVDVVSLSLKVDTAKLSNRQGQGYHLGAWAAPLATTQAQVTVNLDGGAYQC